MMKKLLLFCLLSLFGIVSWAQNNSMDFDGTDDLVNAGIIDISGTALTLETWIKVDQFQAAFPNISSIGGIEEPVGGATNTAMIRIGDAGVPNTQVQFVLQFGGAQVRSNANTQLTANTWTHVAATYDGSNMRIYINGVLDDTQAQTGAFTANGTFMLGSNYNGRFLNGLLDEFRIWSVARSGTEIMNSMNTELTGNEANLVAYYKFDDDAAVCDVKDCSPNENHAGREGMAGANNLPQFDADVPMITDVACGAPLLNCGLVTSCDISAVSLSSASACDDNSTPAVAQDDTFTGDITVTFSNPPASGTLQLSGDASASVAVGDLSGNSYTFTGLEMSADGGPVFINASFSADSGCSLSSSAGSAPSSCSVDAPPADIPTMSEWGLIIFALIMFTLTVVFGTQRQLVLQSPNGSQASQSIRQSFPCDRAMFFQILPRIYAFFIIIFALAILLFGYELTSADIPGSLIAGAIIAYLIQFVKLSK